MNKLSKREKVMIMMLGLIAVVGLLFVFVVRPIMETASYNRSVIADLKIQLQEAEAAIALKTTIESKLAKANEFIDQELQAYYAPMYNWEAERRVVKWLYDNKVTYHSISALNPVTFQPPPEDGSQVDPNAEIPPNGVWESVVVVECETNPEELHNLLNTLYSLKQKAVISSWSLSTMDYKPPEGVVMPENAPTIKVTIKFKLFTVIAK